MNALEILINEHISIMRMLLVLEKMIGDAEISRSIEASHLKQVIYFLKGFADSCHHAKEENMLFPSMIQAGLSEKGGPISVMLHEHSLGREFIAGLQDGLEKLELNEPEALTIISGNGIHYIQLLTAHIEKENNILFPMAGRILNWQEMETLTGNFVAFEVAEEQSGNHGHFMSILDQLSNIYKV
jgi:hemerythrin-like domain-containing protein